MPLPTPVGNDNPTYSLVGFLLPDDMPDMREAITGLLLSMCDSSFWQQNTATGSLTVAQTVAICEHIFNEWVGD